MSEGTQRWRSVAFVGVAAGSVMLALGVLIALSVGTPAAPNPLGVALAALGFIGLFAGGLSVFNLLMFRLLRRLRDQAE